MAPPERPRRTPRSPSQGRPGAPRKPAAGGGGKPPYKRRTDGDARGASSRAQRDGAERKRPDKQGAPPYQRREDGERKPYQRREDRPARAGERKPYPRRDDDRRQGSGPRRAPAPPAAQERPQPKKWGGVTRRGARQVTNPTPATEESKAYERRERSTTAPRPEVEPWTEPRRVAAPNRLPKKAKGSSRPLRAKALPPEVAAEVASAAPNARRAPMLQKRLGDAARHIQHGRDREAALVLRDLSQEVPEAASVRELYGQALYALGRYRQAAKELAAFVELTGSTDQHPMLADSHRALGQHKKVKELWTELREASPSPEIVAEGRIVAAGSLADQGKLREAIALLESAPPVRGRVAERHMRTWYALADLYERSGELSKSRSLFRRVVQHDAEFADAGDRLRALG